MIIVNIEYDGVIYNLKVGKNSKDNWSVLDSCNDSDIFFHLSSFSSAYVILPCNGKVKINDINIGIIEQCARVCINTTKYTHLRNVKVDYTLCSNIKKSKVEGAVEFISNRQVKQIRLA
jgi:predicted ribosome quality control (RQC) complex YloA/Tae2 family protein